MISSVSVCLADIYRRFWVSFAVVLRKVRVYCEAVYLVVTSLPHAILVSHLSLAVPRLDAGYHAEGASSCILVLSVA